MYPLVEFVEYLLPSFIVNSRSLILASRLACWTIVCSAIDPDWLFKAVFWIMIRRIRRFSSDSVLNEMTACSRRVYRACSCKREVVRGEILGNNYHLSWTDSCNSEDISSKNKVTKQKDHDIAFGDNKRRKSVNLPNKPSSACWTLLSRTVQFIVGLERTREMSASIFCDS